AQIAFAIVHQWYDVTGGDNGLLGIWPAAWLAGPLAYYYLALTACGGGIALLARIGRAPFGLTLRAARDHARRAETVGINVRRHPDPARAGLPARNSWRGRRPSCLSRCSGSSTSVRRSAVSVRSTA